MSGPLGDGPALEPDLAQTWPELARQEVEKGRLAGAIRTNNCRENAWHELTVHVSNRPMGTEADPQPLGLQHPAAPRYLEFRIGTFISEGLISRTSSGTAQGSLSSTLILK